MKIQPLVSVVLPTFQHADHIHYAIKSVIAQSYKNWELIVVDNYSTDATEEVVKSFRSKKIRYVKFKNHGVIAASRNTGIELAQGKYVAFLDSDDYWFTDKLAECMDIIDQGYNFVGHGEKWLYANGSSNLKVYDTPPNDQFLSLLLKKNYFSTSSVVVGKSFLLMAGGFDENKKFVLCEDYELWIRLHKIGVKSTNISSILGVYKIHPNNKSNQIARSIRSELCVVMTHFNLINERGAIKLLLLVIRIGRIVASGFLRYSKLQFIRRKI